MVGLLDQAISVLLGSLRLAPLIAFTPPFTLIKVPTTARATIVVALAAGMTDGSVSFSRGMGGLVGAACGELVLGLAMALPLQLAFALIGISGRALDIQVGFGLAFLLDPKTKAQMPLIGALFTYAAGAMFFLSSGPADLVAVLAAGFVAIPVGAASALPDPGALLGFLGAGSLIALGLVGLAMIVLFLIDLVIAMMSRTLPQMNMLVFGFQVKALATLVLLPMTLGLAGAGMLRLIRLALEAMPRMI